MKTEFDWIIEYENLPEDTSELSDLFTPEEKPVRRLGRRFWLLGGLVMVIGGAFLVLWILGGRRQPLPSPDSPETLLKAAIQLEIDALQRGDLEIYNQFQDRSWRRSIMQPPPEAWTAARERSERADLELIDAALIDESSAWARVRFTWDQLQYQLTWFYRQEQGRWLHGDWQDLNMGPTAELSLPRVQIAYHQIHQVEASALGSRLEVLLDDFCQTLTCPADRVLVQVTFDPLFSVYYAQEIAPMSYRIPSPMRVRWLADGQPEPLVLASLGRHIAYDLFAHPHRTSVSPDIETALTLSTFWLAHHLLEHEPVPTIRWLEEACSRDGLPATTAFINALSRDRSPQQALTTSFRPATVAAVHAMPDYYGWLAMVTDPADRIRPQPGPESPLPIRWYQDLHTRLDLATNPWAVEEATYDQATPEMVRLVHQPDWVIAIPHERSDWGTAFFFTDEEAGWVLSRPDESLMGEKRIVHSGPFAITYWAWDEENMAQVLRDLDEVYRAVTSDLGIQSAQEISAIVFSSPQVMSLPVMVADLYLASPALSDLLEREITPDAEAAVQYTVAALLLNEFETTPESGIYILQAIFEWELEHHEGELGSIPAPEFATLLGDWHPPTDNVLSDWRPLADLWPSPPGPPEQELYIYARLLVSYLVEEYGKESLPRMLEALRSSASMAEWVTAVAGRPMAAFEEDWRIWVINY
jgi:hypothetical protein